MSLEYFVCPSDDASPRSLAELRDELARLGVDCEIEERDDPPWLIVKNGTEEMSITTDPDGNVTSAMIQFSDFGPSMEKLIASFQSLGWLTEPEEEME